MAASYRASLFSAIDFASNLATATSNDAFAANALSVNAPAYSNLIVSESNALWPVVLACGTGSNAVGSAVGAVAAGASALAAAARSTSASADAALEARAGTEFARAAFSSGGALSAFSQGSMLVSWA